MHSRARIDIPASTLRELYCERQLSTLAIGRLLGCSKKTVRLRLLEAGIQPRSLPDAFAVSPTHQRNVRRRGALHGSWQGGRRKSDGYVMVKAEGHPNAGASGYVMEHRLVMERSIGRLLLRSEHVHHINHDRSDNRIENLELMTHSQHMALHMKEKWRTGKLVPWNKRKVES